MIIASVEWQLHPPVLEPVLPDEFASMVGRLASKTKMSTEKAERK